MTGAASDDHRWQQVEDQRNGGLEPATAPAGVSPIARTGEVGFSACGIGAVAIRYDELVDHQEATSLVVGAING
ncbi:hypothetical protein OHA46_32100 [Streptomyces sp. NBC_00708]